jgi:hypothetical protein
LPIISALPLGFSKFLITLRIVAEGQLANRIDIDIEDFKILKNALLMLMDLS